MRSIWLIEPVFAEAHIPYIEAYLAGKLPLKQGTDEDDQDGSGGDPLAGVGYALATNAGAKTATGSNPAPQTASADRKYSLDDPELPDDSVYVLDIRGAIFKESTCCSVGTEDYCRLLDQAYAHEKIIGIICLIDSPGGQLSGTPSLYDSIRRPDKPTVSVINEGLMASAAYWLACGSDEIYASQKTDQVGSIGVFVQFEDRTKEREAKGVKLVTVYSDRSSQKNRPFRDALAGDDTLLRDDLNQAADLFREAVEAGRGAKLKAKTKNGPSKPGPDVFEGGLFYASQAIDLGLIDGFGNLQTALDRVVELHQARQSRSTPAPSGAGLAVSEPPVALQAASPQPVASIPSTTITDAPAGASTEAPDLSTTTPETASPAPRVTTIDSSTPNPNDPMSMKIFGFVNLAALSAISGLAAADITDEQLTALNAELAQEGYNVHAISQAQFASIQQLQTQLNTANQTITNQKAEIERLGKQPGAFGTVVPKAEESVAPAAGSENPFFSEADAEVARHKNKQK